MKKVCDAKLKNVLQEQLDYYSKSLSEIEVDFAKKNDVYMLRVRGESMINAGIFDGDSVIVEKCETARNGEMVVALVEDSATVKTFYKENGHFRLQPENDYMEPIIVESVSILGRVVGVYRLF